MNGDVRSRKEPNVAPGTVRGDVKTLNVGNLFAGFLIALLIYLWIAVTVSVAMLGLAVRAGVPACGRRHRGRGTKVLADSRVGRARRHRRADPRRARPRHHRRNPIRARDPLGPQRARAPRLRRELAHPGASHGEGLEHRCTHRRVLRRIRDPARRCADPRHRVPRVVPRLHLSGWARSRRRHGAPVGLVGTDVPPSAPPHAEEAPPAEDAVTVTGAPTSTESPADNTP